MSNPNQPKWIGLGRALPPTPGGTFFNQNYVTPAKSFGAMAIADRVTVTDTYTGPVWLCEQMQLPRGTYGSGFRSGWVCTGCSTAPQGAGLCQLTINWELGGPGANPDWKPLETFSLEVIELNPKVERHDYFKDVTDEELELIKQSVHGQSSEKRSAALDALNSLYLDPSYPPEKVQVIEDLMSLLLKGVETYYLVGLKYTRTQYFFTVPALSLGGTLSDPEGDFAPYLATYGGDIEAFSWLRQADIISPVGVHGSTYKVDSTWLGAPGGHWSPILYTKKTTPTPGGGAPYG